MKRFSAEMRWTRPRSSSSHSEAGRIRGTRSSGNGRSRTGPSSPVASNVMPCCRKIASRRRPAAASCAGPSRASSATSGTACGRGTPPVAKTSSKCPAGGRYTVGSRMSSGSDRTGTLAPRTRGVNGEGAEPRGRGGDARRRRREGSVTQRNGATMGPMLGRTYESQNCSVARTLELVGERWTLLIIRDAFTGVRRFGDFAAHLGIARNVLQDRLERLVEEGVLRKVPYQERPLRHEYRLTDMGRDLWPTIVALLQFGDRHLAGDGPPMLLLHRGCGGEQDERRMCRRCGAALELRDVEAVP